MGRTFVFTEVGNDIHLILHQRNQRRDDDGRSLHQQRGQLVAQRLSASCRHEHEGVLTIHQILDDPLLIAFEFVKSKILLQGFGEILFFCHKDLVLRLLIFVNGSYRVVRGYTYP